MKSSDTFPFNSDFLTFYFFLIYNTHHNFNRMFFSDDIQGTFVVE